MGEGHHRGKAVKASLDLGGGGFTSSGVRTFKVNH